VNNDLMCQVCHRPLDVITDTEGNLQDYWHASGISIGPEHDPVPTPRVEELAQLICDFCSIPEGHWRYPTATFSTPDLPAGYHARAQLPTAFIEPRSIGDWMACDDCHDDIEAGHWDHLAKRSVRHQPVAVRPFMLDAVRSLHREFAKNRSGPPVRSRP
jgi:hypothetical protein